MNTPESIYYYKHHLNPKTEKYGTRWNYVKHDGEERPELYHVLMRKPDTGQKIIYLNKPKPKKGSREERTDQMLANPSISKVHPEIGEGNSLSNLYEADTTHPGYGFGDIRGTDDAILTVRDPKGRTLKIMVFKGLKKQKEVLFQNWAIGGISEAVSYNKLNLSTKTDTQND